MEEASAEFREREEDGTFRVTAQLSCKCEGEVAEFEWISPPPGSAGKINIDSPRTRFLWRRDIFMAAITSAGISRAVYPTMSR